MSTLIMAALSLLGWLIPKLIPPAKQGMTILVRVEVLLTGP